MQTNRITTVVSVAVVYLLALGSVAANAQTKGMIMSRTGDTLIVNGSAGKTTVLLTDDTDTRDNRGAFWLREGASWKYCADTRAQSRSRRIPPITRVGLLQKRSQSTAMIWKRLR
jgi:hypothetical protein